MNKIIQGAVFFLAFIYTSVYSPYVYASGTILSPTPTQIPSGGSTTTYGGVPVYGGGVLVPGQVLINKTVMNPATGFFVDNLGPDDPRYSPEQVVTFRLAVKNSGEQMLSNVSVTDQLPQFIDYMSGPGTYDSNSRTVKFSSLNLAGGESRTYEIKARVVHQALLPAEKNTICPVNVVDAVSDTQKDHDEAQFCIQKQVSVPTVPKSGPEHWMISLIGLGVFGIIGKKIRKMAVSG